MITVGKIYNFRMPLYEHSDPKAHRTHICKVQAMEVVDKNRNKFTFDREVEAGIIKTKGDDAAWEQLYYEIASKYQYQLVICRRIDNGTPILAFGDDLVEDRKLVIRELGM